MGRADAAPNEEVGDGGQSEKPVLEYLLGCVHEWLTVWYTYEDQRPASGGLVDEGKHSEGKLEEDSRDWSTMLIHVCKELWQHTHARHGLLRFQREPENVLEMSSAYLERTSTTVRA